MVRLYAVAGMIVVSMAAICAADVETFTWEEGLFTILFADKPKVGLQVIKLPVGDVTMHIFTAEFPKQTGEMDVAGPKPVVVAARAAIVGKRTVVLYVIGDRAAAAGPSAERFLDSFRVDN